MGCFIIGILVGYAIGVAFMGICTALWEDEYHFSRDVKHRNNIEDI